MVVLKNLLKTAVRNLIRNKSYALINIAGLAVGIACCFLILVYIHHELSFDTFHEQGSRIYRVGEQWHDGRTWTRAITGTAPGARLKDEFPEIEQVVRFFPRRSLVASGDKTIYEDRFIYADGNVFEVFSFSLAEGDQQTALKEPFTVVMTRKMARKYFGEDDPLGRVLTVDQSLSLTVTGILEEVPRNSHLQFDFLASLATLMIRWPGLKDRWDCPAWTYLLLPDGVKPHDLEEKFPDFIGKYREEKVAARLSYRLQPLDQIHLHPLDVELGETTRLSRLYLFAAIALFILLIACVNFVNLSLAQYARRAGEVGVRKALGATRRQLTRQFLGESLVLVAIAALLAVALTELFLPAFNDVAGTDLAIEYFHNWSVPAALAGLILVVGLLAGSYPALILSRLNPVTVLRRRTAAGRKGVLLRRILVVFQFVMSVSLILGTIVIYSQFNHLITKDLGFDTEQMVVVPLVRNLNGDDYTAIRSELLRQRGVRGVTASSTLPCDQDVRGITVRTTDGRDIGMPIVYVDFDYVETVGLNLLNGRSFMSERLTDDGQAFIINESAARALGEDFTVGNRLFAYAGRAENMSFKYDGTVIGMVEDYHFRDLFNTRHIPVILVVDLSRTKYLLVRIEGWDISTTLASIKDVYSRFAPDRPVELSFLDTHIENLYRQEKKFSTIFGYACLLAILVALVGLFGLAAQLTSQRTKEIGIRKVLGASVGNIVTLLGNEFARLVIVANLIAAPIAWYFLHGWLKNYPYRINLSPGFFVAAALITLFLALLAVGYQSFKSATADPVHALRHE